MGKKPSMQWYTGDWLSDPCVSCCSPATRGIWADALSAMDRGETGGILSGTYDQLARVCRCSPDEMRSAVDELAVTQTADVTISNQIVTIKNRRMLRESNQSKKNAQKQQRYRDRKTVTDALPESNQKVTASRVRSSSSSSSILSKSLLKNRPVCDEAEALTEEERERFLDFLEIKNPWPHENTQRQWVADLLRIKNGRRLESLNNAIKYQSKAPYDPANFDKPTTGPQKPFEEF